MWASEADWKKQDACWICGVKFSKLRGVSQHHCRSCGNSVCNRHSMQRLNKPDEPEPVRVCDNCIERSIIEEKRKEYREELNSETDKLGKIKSSNEELFALVSSKQTQLTNLENEMRELERRSQYELERLRYELEQELANSEKTEKLIDSLRKEIDSTHTKERKADEDARLAEQQTRTINEEIGDLRSQRMDVQEQTEFLQSQLEGSVPLKEVQDICCDNCLRRLMAQSRELL
mmetsp:Transcript_12289/g.23319  ORF Transcript_12289/g.23319 Transcript_12289/m.23319 type:complete len:233 (+) Transcript_12289:383-1081(+)